MSASGSKTLIDPWGENPSELRPVDVDSGNAIFATDRPEARSHPPFAILTLLVIIVVSALVFAALTLNQLLDEASIAETAVVQERRDQTATQEMAFVRQTATATRWTATPSPTTTPTAPTLSG